MRTKPAVCHVNLARMFGGGERQTELLVRQLSDEGWLQRLVVRRAHPLAARLRDLRGLEVREVAPNPLSAALATRGATLVHAHEARAVYAAAIARLLFASPFLLTRRVMNPLKPSWFRDRAYGAAAAVVAVSKSAADGVHARLPELGVSVVSDAHAALTADHAQVKAIRERFAGRVLIGHVGSLDDATKGQRTLFEVATRAVSTHPDWQFLLLGDGADREAFAAETAQIDNLHLEGFVDNVGDYLAAFDVFVFPSVREGLGSSLLDAMHAGLPIVASRTGGIPEIIEDGRNGLLVEPRDADGFYDAIELLLGDDALRTRIVEANEQDAERFSAKAMAAAYVEIYRGIVERI